MKVSTGIVYQLLDARGAPLYVGVSADPAERIRQHRFTRAWWPQVVDVVLSERLPRADAEALERDLIRTLQPRHNIADRFGMTAVEIARACGQAIYRERAHA
ncbi:MAG: hypothetical protein SHS37scaffold537_25 [Phage 68_12]|nr:MAG: hypothetical protein SHS37scaffold537_25 [Phage 68_12]